METDPSPKHFTQWYYPIVFLKCHQRSQDTLFPWTDNLLRHCTAQNSSEEYLFYSVLENRGSYWKEIKHREALQASDTSRYTHSSSSSLFNAGSSTELHVNRLDISCGCCLLMPLYSSTHNYISGLNVAGVSVVPLFQIITILWKDTLTQ